jgi:hypothetical protein
VNHAWDKNDVHRAHALGVALDAMPEERVPPVSPKPPRTDWEARYWQNKAEAVEGQLLIAYFIAGVLAVALVWKLS